MVATTVVFLVSAISVLPSGAIAPRNACGSTIVVIGRQEGQADRPSRLGLTLRHGVDAAADRLGHERGVVDGERDDAPAEVVVDDRGRGVSCSEPVLQG